MTRDEAISELIRMKKRYGRWNADNISATCDHAIRLIQELEDRSEEMIEWIKRMAFWTHVDLSNSPQYRDGARYICVEFHKKFAETSSEDPFKIRGWDFNA